MPPKRRGAAAAAARSGQQRLTFHPRVNKVTKPATSSQSKEDLVEPVTASPKPVIPDVAAVASGDETTDVPTSSHEAAIIKQAKREVAATKAASSPEEEAARRISVIAIKKYWAAKEKERKVPRVHQNGLSIYEKILREFDTSSQYGPCLGITRLKRWKRAHKLGLKPPVEVLAVLLKEEDNLAVQKAHMDELLNPNVVTSEV